MNVYTTFHVKWWALQSAHTEQKQTRGDQLTVYEHPTMYYSQVSHVFLWQGIRCTRSLWQYHMLHNYISWPISWSSLPLCTLFFVCLFFLFIIRIIVGVIVVLAASLVSNLIVVMWWECNGSCFQAFGQTVSVSWIYTHLTMLFRDVSVFSGVWRKLYSCRTEWYLESWKAGLSVPECLTGTLSGRVALSSLQYSCLNFEDWQTLCRLFRSSTYMLKVSTHSDDVC